MFQLETIRHKLNDAPWLTDGPRALIRKSICIFRSEGLSKQWEKLDTSIKLTITTRKSHYFNKEADKLKLTGKSSSWYNILNKIIDNDAPKIWSISELEPDKEPGTLAEDLSYTFHQCD